PDREFTASVNSSGNWTLPSSAYDTTSSTLTTKDDALSRSEERRVGKERGDDRSKGPTTDTGSFVLDTQAPSVALTAPPPRTKDTTQSLAGTGGHATRHPDGQSNCSTGVCTSDLPDREFTASVNSSGNWTLPSSAYDTTSSTLTTKDDALS